MLGPEILSNTASAYCALGNATLYQYPFYKQVVTLATYVFFIFTVIGRQKCDTVKKGDYMRSGRMPMDIDLYIPVYTILQFFFYMGLLKVAEQLINPFGDDDEDFELNWLVDRHMKVRNLNLGHLKQMWLESYHKP